MAREPRRMLAALAASVIICLPMAPARSVPPVPGPCALIRGDTESVRQFSRRLIRCAAATWSVPGGATKAICIARRESGLNPRAMSRTGKYLGLYQHSARYWPGRYETWTEPEWQLSPSALSGRSNAVVTMRMVHAHGWGPWRGPGC